MRTEEGRKNLELIENTLNEVGIGHDTADLTDLTWEEQQKLLKKKIEESDGGTFFIYDERTGKCQYIVAKTKEQKAREAEYKAKYEAEVAVMRKSNRAQKRIEQLAKKKAKAKMK